MPNRSRRSFIRRSRLLPFADRAVSAAIEVLAKGCLPCYSRPSKEMTFYDDELITITPGALFKCDRAKIANAGGASGPARLIRVFLTPGGANPTAVRWNLTGNLNVRGFGFTEVQFEDTPNTGVEIRGADNIANFGVFAQLTGVSETVYVAYAA